jgi:glutaredoxin-like protein
MLENKEGQKVPDVTFMARVDGDWAKLTTADLFAGKKVVVFALPGAFTPTCSTTHLPRYSELAPVLKENGIDDIICLSVNDAFVMEAWGKDQNIENVRLIPDGNGKFSEGVGMLVDKSDIGFGKRSWRYSMLVNDGVIEKMFIEPDKPGDPFEVSDADTMLKHIAPNAKLPPEVTIISKPGCPFCIKAKALLHEKGLNYEEILLGSGVSYKSLRNLSGKGTAPQIFIDGKHIDGLDGLQKFFG